MNKRFISCWFLRPWFGVPLGIWVAVSVVYYWWLISRINVLETQNIAYRTQLKSTPTYQVPVIPDAIGTLCETIHIAMVCMEKCTRQVTPMLKSLLHHRQNPLHFHMIVDGASQQTTSKLFETWDLPDVKFSCYNAQNRLSQVQWIPNSHYSGVYALLKLLFPEILPVSLNQVIVLDSDLTFLSDVAELWTIFRNMSNEQLIGLVENESNWYYDVQAKRWPALGRGYNTGVMLLDLNKMRSHIDWSSLWHVAVITNIVKLKQTTLADQDVINAVLKSNPHLVYNVSCQYNIQMSTKTLSKNCYGENTGNIKIIHWNSPIKYNIRIRDSDFFRNIHQSYVNFDGNLLRDKLHRCDQSKIVTYKLNYSDLCVSFRTAQRVKLRTHLYYMDYSYGDIDNFDVTLVVQLSFDRLQFLERLVKYWDGPLSAAIYLSDCEVTRLENFIRDWSDTLSSRRNIGYHLVFKHDSVHYPVNYLRNVALENVNTPYVFLMDVDFVPMVGLYNHLRNAVKLINPYPQKKCLIVAAFESQRYRISPPRSKPSLLARLGNDVAMFRAREWPRGHRPTNYTRWRNATQPYEVEWQSDYEPYLVVHRTVPKYDTRFSGFGWNKVSHSVELRAQGYRAVVLPDAFVVHTPHAPSHDITAFRGDPHYRITFYTAPSSPKLSNLGPDGVMEPFVRESDSHLTGFTPKARMHRHIVMPETERCLALLKQEFMEDLKRKYNVTFEEPSKSDNVDFGHADNRPRGY